MPDGEFPPLPKDAKVTWETFRQRRPSLEAVSDVVKKWNLGTSRAFAGMPCESDVDFDTRLRRAYCDTCEQTNQVIQAPAAPASLCILAVITVMGTGLG